MLSVNGILENATSVTTVVNGVLLKMEFVKRPVMSPPADLMELTVAENSFRVMRAANQTW